MALVYHQGMAVGTITPFAPIWTPSWSAPLSNEAAAPLGGLQDPGDQVTLSGLGPRLAQSTLEAASCNNDLSRQRCYHFVKEGMAAEGIELTGKPAYLAANQLARNPHFQEVRVSRDDLPDLPAGAVVVWNRNVKAGHRNGHISVALGDGREVSDRIRPQVTNYRSQYRVFLPEGATLVARNGDSAPAGLPAGGVVG